MKTTVHIGYPKTGTTYLQKVVFPNLLRCKYLDYYQSEELFKPLIFEERKAVKRIKVKVEKEKSSTTFPVLYSYEGLTGIAFDSASATSIEIAERLKLSGIDKIIITLRSQRTAIDSLYRQFIQQGGTQSFKDWALQGSKPGFVSNYFDYYAIIDAYYKLFGRQNVLVVLQEDMKKNGNSVLNRICAFLESELPENFDSIKKNTNKSLSDASIEVLRYSNRFTKNYFKDSSILGSHFTTWKVRQALQKGIDPWIISRFSGKQNYLDTSKIIDLDKLYAKGNKSVQDLTALPLSEFGYPL